MSEIVVMSSWHCGGINSIGMYIDPLWKFQFHLVVITCIQVLSSIVDQDDYTGFAGTQVWTRAPLA